MNITVELKAGTPARLRSVLTTLPEVHAGSGDRDRIAVDGIERPLLVLGRPPRDLELDEAAKIDSAAGWTQDRRFRQAILHSIDRQQLVDSIQLGFSRVSYFLGFPEDPLYVLAEKILGRKLAA